MAKKSTTKRTLKSLFSRSDANLHQSADKDKDKERSDGDKKKFKFPHFKSKSRSAKDPQQVSSVTESGRTAEDGEVWTENVLPEKKRFSLYATAPRNKDKELSYSELDLRKPKRFATFSFGFKKKKKDEDDISKSSFGLHAHGIEEQDETPQALGQMKLDQPNAKAFSMSEPDLDTSTKFDIPSPPPVATNQSESYFAAADRSSSGSTELLVNGFDIHEEPLVAPIATIPELQLDHSDLADEENPPDAVVPTKPDVWESASGTETPSGAFDQFPSGLPSQAVKPLTSTGDVVQFPTSESSNAIESSPSADTVSELQSEPDITTHVPRNDDAALSADDPANYREASFSQTEKKVPEIAGDDKAPSISSESVYGALYDSLFPQNFNSALISSFTKSSQEIQTKSVEVKTLNEANFAHASTSYGSESTFWRSSDAVDGSSAFGEISSKTEIKHPETKKDFVMIKTFSERHTESNSIHSKKSNSVEPDVADATDDAVDSTRSVRSEVTEIRRAETETSAIVQTPNEIRSQSSFVVSHKKTTLDELDANISAVGVDLDDEIPSRLLDTADPSETKKGIVVKTRYEIETEVASSPPSDAVGTVSGGADGKTTETIREPVMIKTITEINMDDGAAEPSTAFYSKTVRTTDDAFDGVVFASYKSADASSPEILPKHSPTKKSPVLIKTFDEIYTEANWKSSDDSASLGEKSANLTEIGHAGTSERASEGFKILNEIVETDSQYRTLISRESESVSAVNETIDRFAWNAAETRSSSINAEIPKSEIVTEAIIIKTITECNTDDDAANSFDGLPSSGDVRTEEIASGIWTDVAYSETKKPTIWIKTREEFDSDLRKITSDEFGSTEIQKAATETTERTRNGVTTEATLTPPTSPFLDSDATVRVAREKSEESERFDGRSVQTSSAEIAEMGSLEIKDELIPAKTDEIPPETDSKVEYFRSLSKDDPNSSSELTRTESSDVNPRDKVQPEEASHSTILKVRETIGSFVSSYFGKSRETPPAEDSGSKAADGSCIPDSEISRSHSEVKSDSGSLVPNIARSAPVCQPAAPPISDCAASQGTGTRITQQSQIPGRDSEDTSAGARSPSPPSGSVTVKIRTQSLSGRFGRMDSRDGALSPSYLSIGSDDGSVAEVYYSAEEGIGEESGDDIFAGNEISAGRRVWNLEDHRDNMENVLKEVREKEVATIEVAEKESLTRNRSDAQREATPLELDDREIVTNERLVNDEVKIPEREDSTAAQQTKAEARKEELPATPVQQVNAPTVCDPAPPASETGEGSDGKLTVPLETEDHASDEKQLPSPEGQDSPDKESGSSEFVYCSSGNTIERGAIAPSSSEAENPVSLQTRADQSEKVSEKIKEKVGITLERAVTDADDSSAKQSEELQREAARIEHNRTPPSREWADTLAPSLDGEVLRQVTVETSDANEDARPAESQEHPAEDRTAWIQGSLTAPEAAAENLPSGSEREPACAMNSGYSSLSTKLTFKTSAAPKDDESKLRIHKVSLIKDGRGEAGEAEPESDGPLFGSEYKWRNRFEGVSQYVPKTTESSHISSLSDRISDSNSSLSSNSTLPEGAADKHNVLSSSSSSSSSSSYSYSYSSYSTLPLEERSQPSNRTLLYLSRESEPAGWRRSLFAQGAEPAAPAVEADARSEPEKIKSQSEPPPPTASPSSSADASDEEASRFTGVFKATLVDLVPEPQAPPSTPPNDDDSPSQFEMDSLVDTLKNMGPSMRPRGSILRPPAPVLVSSLPPIVEDAAGAVAAAADVPDSSGLLSKMTGVTSSPQESNGLYTLPADLGLRRNIRDSRSPLELMKLGQDHQPGGRNLTLQLRSSTTNSILTRSSSDSSPEELQSPLQNGNGIAPQSSSRLDSSVLFGSYRSSSIDQPLENGKTHRPLFRTGSLPEKGPSNNRMSSGPKELGEPKGATDLLGSRSERLSFLLNSSVPSAGSLPGVDDFTSRMSRPPSFGVAAPPVSNSPTRLLSPTGSIDLQRTPSSTESPLSLFSQTPGVGVSVGAGGGVSVGAMNPPVLQRSFSSEGPAGVQTSLFAGLQGAHHFQSQEPDRNAMSKYRAFPDAYLTKEKEHGKLNPRPGKMYIFDRPGMCGQRLEIRSDVIDATPWELQETISIRVVRGGWVLYEKPNFKGEKIALDEGDIEITYPFAPPEETTSPLQNAPEGNGEKSEDRAETKPARKFVIGSIRRAVRDYSVPEISLFPEENAEGKKVIFRDTSEDARIFGFPIKANSIIINAGLWLVYAQPFFQGVPRVLEVGGYTNPAAWGVQHPYVASLHPLKVGEPRVENLSEPKVVIYDKPYFSGKSRTITHNQRDFMTRTDRQQTAFMYSVGSMKVLGGIWVGYEKEGFRGHQYLLEEGEYHDWRVWGGSNSELRSIRVIRADLSDPLMVMFEQLEEDQEGVQEENTFEVTEAIPDVELFGYKTSTRSIQVLSGAWVAYSHVDFSGSQYILEKGFYNNCADWGSPDTRICSVQPILLAPTESSKSKNDIVLYSEPDFQGECHIVNTNQEALPEKFATKSCRVAGGSWVLHENTQYSGSTFVLCDGDYPNLTSMGVPPGCSVRSVKVVPTMFSVPSISLFGLECLEGREITMETEILSMVEEGFNNHILSLRVNAGCWVICEHSNYRGRQFLLEPIEITNWPKFSSLTTVGSMYPIRQKRHFFRVRNKESGNYMSVQGGVEEMKSGRVVASPQVEPMSEIWFYQDGLLKNKLSANMALQVMGNVEPAAKVVLWTETRQPIQTWTAQMGGMISSLTFPGFVLDVKGGKTYDKDHVVITADSDERPSQQWEIELL